VLVTGEDIETGIDLIMNFRDTGQNLGWRTAKIACRPSLYNFRDRATRRLRSGHRSDSYRVQGARTERTNNMSRRCSSLTEGIEEMAMRG
jgi:hypothetical protein